MKNNVVLALENHSVNDGRWIQAQKQNFNSSISETPTLLEEIGVDGDREMGEEGLSYWARIFLFLKKIKLLAFCEKSLKTKATITKIHERNT